MVQVHKRFTDEQVRMLLHGYCRGVLSRAAIQDMLTISKSSFFDLLSAYRRDPQGFSVAYHRATPSRLSAAVEAEIAAALCQEKELVQDKRLPLSGYNYSAVRDRLAKKGIEVSLTTVIDRAKRLNCYRARAKRAVHDREVLTAAVGALIQHDGSTHQWAPLAQEKWVLITSIDDFSRKLLFADFFSDESTWAHIQATRTLIQTYGVPLRYDELDRYNNHQVHSTTKQIPSRRFEQAKSAGNTLFRPFAPPKPYITAEDVFCLRETRRVNAYRRISLFKHDIEVPNVQLYEDVEVHLIPDILRQVMDIRIWWKGQMVHSVTYPLQEFHVHF